MKEDVKAGSIEITNLVTGYKIIRWIDGTGAIRSMKVKRQRHWEHQRQCSLFSFTYLWGFIPMEDIMSELRAFVLKVQGTYDYTAALAAEHQRINAERIANEQAERVVAKQQTDAAWKRFIDSSKQ